MWLMDLPCLSHVGHIVCVSGLFFHGMFGEGVGRIVLMACVFEFHCVDGRFS